MLLLEPYLYMNLDIHKKYRDSVCIPHNIHELNV